MSMRICTNPRCYLHEGETCAAGHLNPQVDCSMMQHGEQAEGDVKSRSEPILARVPWSGGALGLDDLFLLASRARHMLIGVLGAHDSGKTTLLTANYLKILESGMLGDCYFSGSRTLEAWESLAAWMRFQGIQGPTFPPHTPRGANRVPGMLHIALRSPRMGFRDVLLSDAPGEWFSSWSRQEDAPDAEGAKWIVENSDAFLVVADCRRLAGKDRGNARHELRLLLERLGKHVAGRPVVLVWTKHEFDVPDGIRRSITDVLASSFPEAVQLTSSVSTPDTFVEVLSTIIKSTLKSEQKVQPPITEHVLRTDSFMAFRGHHGKA